MPIFEETDACDYLVAIKWNEARSLSPTLRLLPLVFNLQLRRPENWNTEFFTHGHISYNQKRISLDFNAHISDVFSPLIGTNVIALIPRTRVRAFRI